MSERFFAKNIFNHEELEMESARAKLRSEGKEWVELKKFKQGPEDSSIFGLELLKRWQFANKTGAVYERYMEIGMPEEFLKKQVESAKNLLPDEFAKLKKSIEKVAKSDDKLVYSLFNSYLEQVDNIDEAAESLNFDYKNDEEVEDFIGVEKEADPEIYGLARKRFIASEIADILTMQYKDNHGAEWNPEKQIFVNMLEFHAKDFIKKEKAIKEKVLSLKENLKTDLPAFIKKIGNPVSQKIIEERLEAVDVQVIDGLVASLTERWGDYSMASHTIRVASHVPDKKLNQVYTHEVMHALSGMSEMITSPSFEGFDNPEMSYLTGKRLGLSLKYHDESEFLITDEPEKYKRLEIVRPDLSWLNEAVTESLAIEMTGASSGSYKSERELFEMILKESGIPRDVFIKAYFENYKGDRSAAHSTPNLKALFNEINKAFLSNGFLVDLDICMNADAVKYERYRNLHDSAGRFVKKWKDMGRSFIPFISMEAQKIRKNGLKFALPRRRLTTK